MWRARLRRRYRVVGDPFRGLGSKSGRGETALEAAYGARARVGCLTKRARVRVRRARQSLGEGRGSGRQGPVGVSRVKVSYPSDVNPRFVTR